MAKYYYNGVLLPEIPADVLVEYPYVFIGLIQSTGGYQILASANPMYIASSAIQRQNSNSEPFLYCVEGDEEWTSGTSGNYGWSINSDRILIWSNHDVPNGSATATDIYLKGSQPTLTPIRLVNQNQASSNGETSCSVTMTGCTVGNMLIFAYAVRGDGNNPTLPNGWVKLGGGNNTSDVGATNQKLYFAYKIVTSSSETVTITQSTTGVIYAVCSEYSSVNSVIMRNDLASIGLSDFTVTGSKSKADDVMVYGVASTYYTSGRNQTATPADLDKIEGDSRQEGLACWFDGGLGALEHTFRTCSFTEERDAVLECVQLLGEAPLTQKYLIRNHTTEGSELMTVTDGALRTIPTQELTSETFQTYGVDEAPASDLLITLSKFDVLLWHSSEDEQPNLTAEIKAVPPTQTVVTDLIDMSHPSVLGVSAVTVTDIGNPLFAVSFDSKTTWEYWTGTEWAAASGTEGMSKETLQSITTDQWAEKIQVGFYLKMILHSSDTVESIVIDFVN